MKLAAMRHGLEDAQSVVAEALSESERERKKLLRLSNIQERTKKKVRETLEHTETVLTIDELTERINALNLVHKILLNMHTNLHSLRDTKLKDLRPNQWKGLSAFIEFMKGKNATDLIGYFKQPTGAGKTVFFGVLAKLIDVQTLILVPRNALLQQTKDELIEMLNFDEADIGIVGEGECEIGHKITIGTYQSHIIRMKAPRGDERGAYKEWMEGCEFVVCDEGHRSLGRVTRQSLDALYEGEWDTEMTDVDEKYQSQVLNNLGKFTPRNILKLGFSATPRLADKSMDEHFKHKIAEESYGDLVRAGVVTKFKIIRAEGEIFEEEARGYMSEERESAILQREHMAKKLLRQYVTVRDAMAVEKKRLFGAAFCPTIDECDRFVAEATKLGIKCEIVTTREKNAYSEEAHLPRKERKGIVKMAEQRLLGGEIDLIVTVDMLSEGWNCRPPNCAIMDRITYSEARAIQPPGRVARAYDNKDYAYVFEGDWDVVGKSAKEQESRRVKKKVGKGSHSENAAHGRKPLTFAAALHQYGENVDEICEGLNGEKILFEKNYKANPDGTVLLDGERLGVVLPLFANHVGTAPGTLKRIVESSDLKPIGKAKGLSGVFLDVYLKSEVESLDYLKGILTREDIDVDSSGRTVFDGQECIFPTTFALANGMGHKAMKNAISAAGIEPVAHAKRANKTVPIYPAEKILNLTYVKDFFATQQNQIESDGTILINGVLGITEWIYGEHIEMSGVTLKKAISNAKLKPIGLARNLNRKQPVFDKSEVDALPEVIEHVNAVKNRVPDSGLVMLETGEQVVAITSYARSNGITIHWLNQAVLEAGLVPIAKGKRGSTIVDLFKKEDVDRLPYFVAHKKNR